MSVPCAPGTSGTARYEHHHLGEHCHLLFLQTVSLQLGRDSEHDDLNQLWTTIRWLGSLCVHGIATSDAHIFLHFLLSIKTLQYLMT